MSEAALIAVAIAMGAVIEELRLWGRRKQIESLHNRLQVLRHDRDTMQAQLKQTAEKLDRARESHRKELAAVRSDLEFTRAVLDGLPDTPTTRAALHNRRKRLRVSLPGADEPGNDHRE